MQQYRLVNSETEEVYLLEQPTLLLGRAETCDIHFDSNLLSRQHAAILVSEDRVVVKDLGSTNGTFVNQVRIYSPTAIKPGDVLAIGEQRLCLEEIAAADDLANSRRQFADDELVKYSADDNTSNRTMIRSSFKPTDDYWPFLSAQSDTTISDEDLVTEALARHRVDRKRVPAVLIIKSGRRKGEVFDLKLPAGVEKHWTLGRSPLSDVVLSDPTVSSTHAHLYCEQSNWFVADNQSTNGVKLNNIHVKQSKCKSGDVVSMGNIELLFYIFS